MIERTPCDLLVAGDHVLPVTDGDPVLADCAVVVVDGVIREVGPRAELEARWDAADTLSGGIVLPGLVNTHGHAGMTLYRGLGDDMPLMEWLERFVWPAEKLFTNEENVRLGTELAIAEMLASGTTAFADMYFYEHVVGHAAARAGIRVLLGQAVIGFPTPGCPDTGTCFQRCRDLIDGFTDEPLVDVSMALHSIYTLSPADLENGARHAADWGVPIQIHLSETAGEVERCLEAHGTTPARLIESTGVLREGTICAHGVHLEREEMELIAARGGGVSLNPESNLKLGSGIADVPAMLAAGVRLGLGTDGAASNNDLDLWDSVKLTALLAKGVHGDPTAVPAELAVRMATLGGAEILGMADRVGSLEPGKRADLCIIDTGSAAHTPIYHPYSQLAYGTNRGDVVHTVVDGRVVYRDRLHTTLDVEETAAQVRTLSVEIAAAVLNGAG